MEFTGSYYKCNKCKHIWDYNDFCCPECGAKEIEDINSEEINVEIDRLVNMLDSHGDYSSKRANDEYD